jgi:hypothetical protein
MKLDKLANLLNEAAPKSIQISVGFPYCTILTTAGKSGQSNGSKVTGAKTEVIDPENEEPSEPQQPSQGQGDNREESKSDSKNLIGKIIQDTDTGEYGRVTAVNGDDIEYDPVPRSEVEKMGILGLKRIHKTWSNK